MAKEEQEFHADIKKLFYPDTQFIAPGMDRKNSEDEEEDDAGSLESSDEELGAMAGLDSFT